MKIIRLLIILAILAPAGFVHAQVYTTTTIISGLQNPVAFDFSGDGRIFLTQKGDGSIPSASGSAIIKTYSTTGTFISNFYDLSDSVNSDFERGLLGIAVDPAFLNNHYLYVYYVHILNNSQRIRIVRFTEAANIGTNPQVIFDMDVTSYNPAGNHFGGNIHFRPSDPTHIYFTIGDLAYHQTSAGNYAQMLTKPFGKTLRIGKDPVPPGSNVHAVGGFSCNVPTDNPFYDDGIPTTGNCDIIWSYGHRNPFDFTFSPTTDTMYVAENGLNTWDEVDVIHRGANYGWNTCEGRFMNSSTSSPCNLAGSVLPLEEFAAPVPSLTGILFYTSSVMPEFTNHLLVADNNNARIYNLTLGNAPAYDTLLSRSQWQDMSGGFTTLKQGTEGCVYVMTGGYTSNGNIKRICPQGLGIEDHNNPYFSIQPNVPNPFSTTSTLTYSMKQNSTVHIGLYDLGGKEVAVLVDGAQSEGEHTFEINAQKLGLAPGLYFCLMNSNNFTESVKISVIK